ncbi:response regulator [Hyphomicrobium sulfonivorans]|uniref:Two-component response regulator n=1 Tax=Hyphomicrobium sulfonivorans TaxID=121290 RepID=A0A109BBE9_HYPSL|nr:response regulator transcription factor [Hyphomicrobium sulfonivorans]KWT65510.1 two-component response regulator [Hyphomicrobium sulfonivorans]MBI1649618.1 response regulator transcription factor [Hyphomicrobium sulfonivorans]NSL71533.1 DNA-binding response regulator [Hyphomicrobium sulfonivorans]
MVASIRVLLVDDHAVVREGYRRLIEMHRDIDVVAEAEDAASGYKAFKDANPDVVVVDISMPGRGGIDLVRQIRQLNSEARILIFTMHASATYAQQAFNAGARGYVTKSSPPDVLVSAIRSVYAGRPALCAEINEVFATSRLCGESTALDDLSPREFEVLRMILDAKPTDEIASAFNLSPKTIANYHYEIKSKLGVRSDIELVYFCMRQGLVKPVEAGS